MADRYGSASAVINRTGIKHGDLGLATAEDLTTFVGEVLDEITDLLDRKMGKSYLADATVPAGLNGIANDIAADSARTMVVSRQTPVVRIDDFAVRTVTSRTFAPDILDRLELYSANTTFKSVDVENADFAPFRTELTAADLDTMDL